MKDYEFSLEENLTEEELLSDETLESLNDSDYINTFFDIKGDFYSDY